MNLEKGDFDQAVRHYKAAVDRDERPQNVAPAEHAAILMRTSLVVPYSRDVAIARVALALSVSGPQGEAQRLLRDSVQLAMVGGGTDRASSVIGETLQIGIGLNQCDAMMPFSTEVTTGIADNAAAKRLHSLILNQIGYCLMITRHPDRATEFLSQSIKDLDGIDGVPLPELATPSQNYGWALTILGRNEEAFAPLRRALRLRKSSLGPVAPRIAESAASLAGAIVVSGKLASDPALKAEATDAIDLILNEEQYRTIAKMKYVSAACLNSAVRSASDASPRDQRAQEICRSFNPTVTTPPPRNPSN
jgi:tetratricopeptide (TPR) repeat protein